MKRSLLFAVSALGGLMLLATPASAADLNEAVCEDPPINGTWDGGTSTCSTFEVFDLMLLSPFVVPSGVTLDVELFVDGPLAEVTNFGTITIGGIWHNDETLHNYGTLVAERVDHENVFNHCGSTYTVTFDFNNSLTNLDCSVDTTITAAPTSGSAPLTVDWTITVLNDGDDPLSGVEVALSTDGGATAYDTLTGPPTSGDDGDGVLGVGETWVYVVQRVETGDVTLTATVSGTAPSGLVVTIPDDPEAQAAASVTVAAATTTTTSTTSTTSTSTTLATTTTSSTAPTDVAPATLPLTGSGAGDVGAIAVSLLALGGLVMAATRRQEETD